MSSVLWWLAGVAAVVALLRLVAQQRRHHAGVALANIARQAKMNYSHLDRFELAARLGQSPRWTAGLSVHDVVYGTSGEQRRFVATCERRPTPDDWPQRWVVTCAEHLDHRELHELAHPRFVKNERARIAAYRSILADD